MLCSEKSSSSRSRSPTWIVARDASRPRLSKRRSRRWNHRQIRSTTERARVGFADWLCFADNAGRSPTSGARNRKHRGKLDNCRQLLRSMRLELVRFRTGGLNAQPTGLTMVTQQAQSVVRDMGYLSDANAELNAL